MNRLITRSRNLVGGCEFSARLFCALSWQWSTLGSTNVPPEKAVALISSTRVAAREAELTGRELEILRLLGKGGTTPSIAGQLHISRTIVNNHVQHILRKLDSHTRLEAIRRAEYAGLI